MVRRARWSAAPLITHTMSITNKILAGLLFAALAVVGAASFGIYAKANPSFFIRSSNTSTVFPSATTTTTYFNAGGVSTTTLAFDLGVGGAQGADSASLLVQLTSTTSQPTLNIDIQYSQDNVDWYAANLASDFQQYATGTPTIGPVQTIQFLFSTSTINRTAAALNGTATSSTNRIVNLKVPTRYIRAINYITPGTGSTAALLWEEFVAKRQSN